MKISKRLLSLLLCVLMISTVACLSVSAKTVYPFGDWVVEKINKDTEFTIDNYTGNNQEITVPLYFNDLPITSISANVFNKNETITSVTLKSPCVSIGEYAFAKCTNLTRVVLNPDVNFIGDGAFSGCSSLSEIYLGDTKITSVGTYAFNNCDALTEVTLPNTVTTLARNSFSYCDNLTKITIPQSVTSIDDNAFYSSKNVVIYCYENSAAHTFAEAKGIEYVLIDTNQKYILGDTDGDGQISVLDATATQLLLAWLIEDTDGRMAIRGDVDQDGQLSITDATSIQFYLAEYEEDNLIGRIFNY